MTKKHWGIRLRTDPTPTRLLAVLLWTILALGPGAVVKAQVPNDACSSAMDLGVLQVQPTCTFNNANGEPTAFPFSDSTVLAVPDFPYPAMPLTCNGYAPAVTVPSNDMWYKFYPGCWFSIEVEPGIAYPTDTLHMSLWLGPDCSQLVPLKCYTLAANTALNDSLIPLYDGPYYLQVSSPSLTSISRFSICLRAHCWPISPAVYTDFEATPVQCFPYALSTVSATTGNNDGGATLLVDAAYGPYDLTWSDGVQDSLARHNLGAGIYFIDVTDVNGCTQNIEVVVADQGVLGVGEPTHASNFIYDSVNRKLRVDLGCNNCKVSMEIVDLQGKLIRSTKNMNGISVHDLSSVPPGSYVLVFLIDQDRRVVQKLTII
ncbi:MAG: T9SS type A sorting domain-containing protein [Flavobacteriales bacterium]|nr:T9SS type A sorting domain-containing protein [Flavobacteriales bacterium]